jgi:MFS-type transporter involved in bile tolerance (Atg22 family)
LYDWANSTFGNSTMSAFLPPYLFLVAQQNEDDNHQFDFLPGLKLSGESYYSTLTPILVALQALTLLLCGTLGDFGSGRKKVLVISSFVGSVAGVLLFAVEAHNYWLGGVLVIISNVGIGLSVVMYNAYLPIMVRNLPEVRGKEAEPNFNEVEQIAMNKVSSRGFMLGYVAGLTLLLINVGISVGTSRTLGGNCNKWCVDCPSSEGNLTMPGWLAYDYVIRNETMLTERNFCSRGRFPPFFVDVECLAWPGINPPCGWGQPGDIDPKTKECLNTGAWKHYTYSPAGVRWSLNQPVVDDEVFAQNVAANRTDICTLKSTVANKALAVSLTDADKALNQSLALKLESGNTGCPHFYCSRKECARGFEPEKCDPKGWGSRINIMSGALWWFAFAFFTYFWLRPRPAPPLPEGKTYIGESFRRMWAAAKKIKRLRNTLLFLLSFWFSSDGYGTITTGATIIAAKPPLSFGTLNLGLLLLVVNVVALLGNIFYQYLGAFIIKRWVAQQIALGENPETLDTYWIFRHLKFANLAFLMLLPIWGLPGVGLTSAIEFFIAAAIYGFQIGAIQSHSRSLMSHFTPVGCEGEFFGFYELTDKGTAWLGPLVLVIATEKIGEVRWALGIITFFFVVSGIFLFFVDVKAGGLEALNFDVKAEVEMVEEKGLSKSIRIEDDEPTIEQLQQRVHDTRKIIARKTSKQDVLAAADDAPGVLTSAKTKIGTLKADDEKQIDLGVETVGLATSFDKLSAAPDLFTPRDEPEDEEPPAPAPRKRKSKKSKVDVTSPEPDEEARE